jgi:hypothetical protein
LGKILAGGAPLKDTTEVDFDASTRFFFDGSRQAAASAQLTTAIKQLIQDVLGVTLVNTSLAEKQEHHDLYRHEVIHTTGECLQQED